MSTIVGAALPLLAPQSFAQGTLERRVASTKDADFVQTVIHLPLQSRLYSQLFERFKVQPDA